MLSLKTESDILAEAPRQIRAHRLALSWRQVDLATRSGVPIATLRRFERTGRIGFAGFVKLAVTLGLADRLLEALAPKLTQAPRDMKDFLRTPPARQRVRRPSKA